MSAARAYRLAAVACLTLVACSDRKSVGFVISLPSAIAGQMSATRVQIREGTCNGSSRYDEFLPTTQSPVLSPGAYRVVAIATDSMCRKIAERCEPLVWPTASPVRIVLDVVSPPQGGCASPAVCNGGRCVSPSDAGLDANLSDTSTDNAMSDTPFDQFVDRGSGETALNDVMTIDVTQADVTQADVSNDVAIDTSCPGTQHYCDGRCVSRSNVNHCGICNNACAGCSNGLCPSCNGVGEMVCGGTCVNTTNNNQHCGACPTVCGAGQSCVNSACQCASGQILCSGVCVDNNTDPENCDTCGHRCQIACVNGGCANGGYGWVNSAVNFVDVCTWQGSTLVTAPHAVVSLAQQPMRVYGQLYSDVHVYKNGFLSFESEAVNTLPDCLEPQLPAEPDVGVFPLWADLTLNAGVCVGTGSIGSETVVGFSWSGAFTHNTSTLVRVSAIYYPSSQQIHVGYEITPGVGIVQVRGTVGVQSHAAGATGLSTQAYCGVIDTSLRPGFLRPI